MVMVIIIIIMIHDSPATVSYSHTGTVMKPKIKLMATGPTTGDIYIRMVFRSDGRIEEIRDGSIVW